MQETQRKEELSQKYLFDASKLHGISLSQLSNFTIAQLREKLGLDGASAGLLKSELIRGLLVSEQRRALFTPYKDAASDTKKKRAMNFFCLARPTEFRPPQNKEKYRAAGLGPKRIVFPDEDCEPKVMYQLLEESYKELSNAGGYSFYYMPPGKHTSLTRLIETHPDGFNPLRLSETPGAIKYIRPVQSVLSLTPQEVLASPSQPKVSCTICNDQVPVSQIATHFGLCKQKLDDDSDSKDDDMEDFVVPNSQRRTRRPVSVPVPRSVDVPPPRPVAVPPPRPVAVPPPRHVSLPTLGSRPIRTTSSYRSDVRSSDNVIILSPPRRSTRVTERRCTSPSTSNDDIFMGSCPFCDQAFTEPLALISHSEQCLQKSDLEKNRCLREALARLKLKHLSAGGYVDELDCEKLEKIDRQDLYRGAFRMFKRMGSSFLKVSIEFVGEDGLDGGAIWKEFFTLLFKEATAKMFEGEVFMCPKVSSNETELVELGRMISYCLLFQGPLFQYLPPSAALFLISGNFDSAVATEDELCNPAVKQLIKHFRYCVENRVDTASVKVDDAGMMTPDAKNTLHQFLWEHYSCVLQSSGADNGGMPHTADMMPEMMHRVIQYDVIASRSRLYGAIRRGLQYNGVLLELQEPCG